MPEKDPENVNWLVQAIPLLLAALLAAIGGAVQYLNKIDKNGIRFSFSKFLLEIFTSGFVGILSFLLCDMAGFGWEMTAAVVAISGHMGARAIVLIENRVIGGLKNGNS